MLHNQMIGMRINHLSWMFAAGVNSIVVER